MKRNGLKKSGDLIEFSNIHTLTDQLKVNKGVKYSHNAIVV